MKDIKQNNRRYADNFSQERARKACFDNEIKCQVYRFGEVFKIDDEIIAKECDQKAMINYVDNSIKESLFIPSEDIYKDLDQDFKSVVIKKEKRFFLFSWMVLSPIVLCVVFLGAMYVQKGIKTQGKVLGVSKEAYNNINIALGGVKERNFSMSENKFGEAYENFAEISASLEGLGKGVISISRFVPGASKLSSGYHAIEAGKNLSLAGEKISQIANDINSLKDGTADKNKNFSLLDFFVSFDKDLNEVNNYLVQARDNLNKVKITDIPEENQEKILALKNKLPMITQAVGDFSANNQLLADLIGANGPRKYLFLFQNNQEMRATGGFIGSYGVLDIDSAGRIRNFFIDGIFNPDGQLTDKIIPPKPIQKISTAWSLHDSNWFPDFPISARKAMLFYEKTGGPTVDGVVTLTPTVMQKLLNISGPIDMKDYGVVLTGDNFIENVQHEVEEGYDKEENRPKKILSDLAPLLMDRIFNSKDVKVLAETLNVFSDALAEKHILLYFSNSDLQKIVSNLGWSGEILETSKDYLSVINTNINGYKTDGVVKEKINQQIDISSEGEITSTVSITRKHTGGNSQFQWWNKVNADYMRVYVPQGSTLIEVDGQTREINSDILDYKSLKFEEDVDVKNEEMQMQLDDKTGTRVYVESGKTVFANWVYVSPQEEVTVKYKYLLPFKIDRSKEASSYSLLNQKQSGSLGDEFAFILNYPKNWKEKWKSANLKDCSSKEGYASLCLEDNLKTDKFFGIVFGNE
ncbi:MAG: hypothetical protein UR66_C0011G0021 [Candidatus Moranbacteria bacterium GW2011_GWE1_35_17]|nr:MAG: hypothetical protein UR66_C0011G0021 [Candidatus Moranbacteria bacterium GW2011_GWE1_35_17]KKP84833.1 MAG: hypothetical protein UR83_C0010G0002 [Candidatus Moranbacteria bacterium GW2011_GWF2_35_54]